MDIKYGSAAGFDGVNQDRILCGQVSGDMFVAILADGIGGLQHGGLAADIVVQSIWGAIKGNIASGDIPQVLTAAFCQADFDIAKQSQSMHCKMGAAVTVVVIKGDSLYCAWQGNVRLYFRADGKMAQLTEDHIKSSDCNTLLTRCVNGKGYRRPVPILTKSLQGASSLMLCSDGFYQSAKCMAQALQGELPSAIESHPDDASCIIMKIKR